ncbi:endonuclease/exonuclease/phosphatase family protein [Nocardiopsis sp. HNM0947]|uniref:Endonuclease/exonuclease/phosphatase family protein n=1 Tax=Nocardiopsis coralli TaxID=2772213 RepID=A0ABR9PB16_9ACTN|nr:endonuclease/exonuclease/phosphatase family protein [Nocardiopsis coralli]MBE3001027.1 endonuclease/exonuclease/phosphatase family protein [Nocardiopsis coralli]
MSVEGVRAGLRSLAAVAGAVIVAAGTAAHTDRPAAAEADPGGVQAPPRDEAVVGQLNLWGSVAHYGQVEGPVSAVAAEVRAHEPLALTLQEACENQVEALAADLDGYGYVFEPVRSPEVTTGGEREPMRCRGIPGQEAQESDAEQPRFGNAVLVRQDAGFAEQGDPDVGRFDLGTTGERERRTMVCTPSQDRGLAVCSTHLSAGEVPDVREAEVRVAADRIQEHYGDGTAVLGGDLNMQPHEAAIDFLYHPAYDHPEWTEYPGQGHLRHLMSTCGDRMSAECREGAATFDGVDSARQHTRTPERQLDHLFASTDVAVRGSRVTEPPQGCDNPVHGVDHEEVPDEVAEQETISCSDHEMLWAQIGLPQP